MVSDPVISDDLLTRGFIGVVGLRFETIERDRVVGTLDVTPKLLQPHGIVHGGVWCTVVEALASVGAAVWLGEAGRVVGTSNSTDFLRPITTGSVTAEATPVHRGHTQQLWLVEIRDERRRLVARGQVRLQNLRKAPRVL